MMGLDMRRMRAIARRHAIVFKRSPHRWFDVAAPAIDSILFGSLAVVLSKSTPGDDKTVPTVLTGLLLFHILFASNLALSTGFLEETWTRSLLNMMVTPLRETEYLIGTAVFGLSKVFIGMVFVSCTALLFYAFNVTTIAVQLLPSAIILLFMGWVLALFVIGLVLRFGAGAEVLAWALAFLLWPLSGAFYAVGALPTILQPIARILPTTHAFAASRAVVAGDPLPWDEIAIAAVGSIVLAALALWWVRSRLEQFRQRGYITRYS
jgi:ABC-2 type transport system permease protein